MILTVGKVFRHRLTPRSNDLRGTLLVGPDATVGLLRRLSHCPLQSITIDASSPEGDALRVGESTGARIAEMACSPAVSQIVIAEVLARDESVIAALEAARARGVRVSSVGRFMEIQFGQLSLDDPDLLSALTAAHPPRTAFSRAVKRLMDVSISATLLLTLLPLMVMTSIVVRLQDRGPALFRQQRVGLNAGQFTLLKFRSMRLDAEADGVARWALRNDNRVTPFGRVLRLYRLDELPQLINVLRGEMSLVGPRPERPEIACALARSIPHFDIRHRVKPGLTGWAQVNFPYGASLEDAREKTRYDLFYVKNGSIVLDLLILLQTVRVVMFAEGSR